jgi:hypothetical protein
MRSEYSVLIFATSDKVVTNDFDVEVKLLGSSGGVGEDRNVLVGIGGAGTDTDDNGRPVTNRFATVTPYAALLGRGALRINIVLSGCGQTSVLEVSRGIGARQGSKIIVSN